MLFQPSENEEDKPASLIGSLVIGAVIGLLSGMLGIGGGIILSPVILLFRWAKMKETAAISALFIFVNSISGLLGLLSKGVNLSTQTISWIAVAFVGGLLGAYFGSKRFNVPTLRYILAFVLIIACVKLYFT